MYHFLGNLSAFDLAEVNPKLGSPEDVETTVKSGIELISAAFGKRTVDFIPEDYQIPRPE
jgi:arginase family enzyme